jgi:RHS repeat-associated protein
MRKPGLQAGLGKCFDFVRNAPKAPTRGTCSITATEMFYWRSVNGGTLAESDLGGNWTAVYGLVRGQIYSRVDLPANVVHYYFEDRLKTTDIVTGAACNIRKEPDYYPYGGEIVITGSDFNRYKFTGKERDTESNLDEFGARYYASTMGRFMTPDWAAKPISVPYANAAHCFQRIYDDLLWELQPRGGHVVVCG